MNRYKHALRMAFRFSRSEFWPFMIAVVFSGFILSFRQWMEWGQEIVNLDVANGISSFVLYTLLFMVIYFLFIAAQKFVAAYMGYECTIEVWPYGPVVGVMITFLTFGLLPFLYLSGVHLKEDPALRLGKFRYYLNIKDLMYVGLAGPIFIVLMLLLVVQPLFFLTRAPIFNDITVASAWILLFSSLPLPKTNGINVLLKSRTIWVVYFAFSFGLFLLLKQLNITTYIVAFIIILTVLFLLRKIVKMKD